MKRIFFIVQVQFMAWLCCCLAYGQSGEASKNIITKLTTFSANHPAEKAYLQFDKPYYAAGDTIYFKAYITKGERHELSGLSGVLHVDLINTKNKTDQSIKLQIDSGVAWGDFALPDTLPQGNYRVRAYTQLMRNDEDKYFFDKVIPVGSSAGKRIPESMVKQPAPANLKPDVQFLPEGGSLVTGIRSKVAFKVTGSDGRGIDIKGKLTDNNGGEVASFASEHLGMGYFYLNPSEGKTYKAEITYANGMHETMNLPKPETSGLVLSVDNDSLPKASVTIAANAEYYNQNKGKSYTLLIYSGGIATTVNCKLDSPIINLDILKRKLHTGIATVTLFSPENEPLCERLFFVQNYDQLSVNVNGDKNNYSKREKVNIKLNVLNRKGDPAEGHFSVSVIDESKVPADKNNEDNILSYLLLTSDLKGYIEQPAYYFADSSSSASKNLDLLMLTQGYRRFEWKQVLDSTNKALTYQPEKGIEITGQVKNLFNNPVANGTINLVPSKGGPFLSGRTDNNGMFRFADLVFNDTVHFVLNAATTKGKNATKITWFNKPNEPVVYPNPCPSIQTGADTALTSFVNNEKLQQQELVKYGHAKGIMLKEVKINEKKEPLQRSQSLVAEFAADQVIQGKDIQYGGPLSIRLASLLHGFHLQGVGMFIDNITMLPPMVLIDGMPHNNIDDVSTDGVETIEVLKPPNSYVYGTAGLNGVLVITTKPRTSQAEDIMAIGVLPIAPIGFYKAREFYSPKYDNASLISKQQDLRSTIYWKPELQTDKAGNASFEYYNADGTGTYKMVIEGIDNKGNIGMQVYRYKVE
jgi:hypothetical protein